ncbi:MAG: plasmid pRiA4b ORF-3 family protein [Bacteroidales bacterium]|nr:plasmid pRiA4b ORF-3 family protein [Bacteroidales bacterium]
MKEIKAYRLTAFQHIQFLTHKEGYEKYVDYWNDKLKQQVGTFAKDTLYHMHIVLMGFEPYIWRTALVKPEMPLAIFHRLIQQVMGWQDLHLHHFIKGDTFYVPRLDDGGRGTMKQVDYSDLSIKDILTKQHERIIYEYDFGDGWQHEIWLDKIVTTGKKDHPICLNGMMRCPPEDSGGVWGYMNVLEKLTKLDEDERKLFLEDNFKDDFNPDYFDKHEINQQLKQWKAVWLNKWK